MKQFLPLLHIQRFFTMATEHYKNLINKLTHLDISKEQKDSLLQLVKKLENEHMRLDFLHNRSAKDRSITINLLKESVEELENQKLLLEHQSFALDKNFHALQMSYTELEQFAFIASHDLKSPLRNISGFSKILKNRYYDKLDHEAREFIDYIVHNTQMMNDIISGLLEFSGVDREKELILTDFNEVIELVHLNLQTTLETNNAIVHTENLPKLNVYKVGMIQLLQNLIENAVKYRSEETPKIHISAQQMTGFWQFSLVDNGVGLNETYAEKAFLPFQRIDHRDRPGMGMGLAICRKVVKAHGGDIWFTQNKDALGTTFYFTIPENIII